MHRPQWHEDVDMGMLIPLPSRRMHACWGWYRTIMWRTDVDVSAVRRWAGESEPEDQFAKVHQTGPER